MAGSAKVLQLPSESPVTRPSWNQSRPVIKPTRGFLKLPDMKSDSDGEPKKNGSVAVLKEGNGFGPDGSTGISEDELVRFNVSGMVYETQSSTLEKFPDTLLGNKLKLQKYFIKSRNSYFLDRHRHAFEAILYYYQSGGVLIRPPTVPMVLFAEEIAFYEISEEAFLQVQLDEGYIQEKEKEMPTNKWQRRVWELFECPDTSPAAKFVAIWSVFVIVLSITVFCIETLPQFQQSEKDNFNQPWFSFEMGCICWFTLEYVMRLLSSPRKWKFMKSFMNVVDVLAILPYFITLGVNLKNTAPLSVLRAVRLVRVFRIFKLSRHSLGLRILGHTLRASVSELGMLMFFLVLGVVVFSSAIYYCESGENAMFQSIPDAFWYSLVTMTTVGYGDKYPITVPGKFVGAMCAIVGVLTIALPVPVIVSNFEFFYKRDRLTYELERKEAQSTKHKSTFNPDLLTPESCRRSLIRPDADCATPDLSRRLLVLGTPQSARKGVGESFL